MSSSELKNYTRGIAYQAIKLKKNKITQSDFLAALESLIGESAFAEALAIYEKAEAEEDN
jgi:ATP-dependent 26S proteasome regulatory subunit